MRFDTIIANGAVVNANKTEKADIGIRGEKISAVSRNLAKLAPPNGTRVIDASGCYVIPGAIDVHVHLDMPFCGTTSSDDYITGTKAAARGGVTTVIDFALPSGDDTLQDAVNKWMGKAEGKACVDYAFHLGITNWARHKAEIKAMIDLGIPTFKQFMIYAKEGLQSTDREIFCALEEVGRHGGMLMTHAESNDVLEELIERHHNKQEMKKLGAELHAITRPNFIEAEAIRRAVTWSEATGGPLYIVHMSTGEGVEIIADAQRRGHKQIFAETCAQYLVLDDSSFKGKDGHLFATCPQLKKKADQAQLWKGLKDGTVTIISTDTCTFTRKQKAMWKGDFTKIPMGMPGVETMVPIAYTHGVLKKRMTLRDMVKSCCSAPAKLMGLGKHKGAIRKGYDADIAILHPTNKIKVDYKQMETNADWSPFQGWPLAGFSRTTLSRGKVIVDNYKFCGEEGWGRFQPRAGVGKL